MWNDIKTVILIGICSAICIAIVFVNPYKGSMDLSELILQLSGSTGEFCLGSSLPELVGFMLCMIPNYIVTMVLGNSVYRYFCTASIYIFSRCSDRRKWYVKTIFHLFVQVCVYEIVSVTTVVLITALRYGVVISVSGNFLFGYHVLLYTMWNFAWVLLINICAIKKGSSSAFLLAIGIQIFLTSCLSIINILEKNHVSKVIIERIVWLNPVAHTVVGWHRGILSIENLAGTQHSICLSSSIILMLLFCIITILIGNVLIQKHDLLIENMEAGVM
ncbi:MAG: hypothetical protein ACI4DV_07395 [Lachnospiraceae bacterium]